MGYSSKQQGNGNAAKDSSYYSNRAMYKKADDSDESDDDSDLEVIFDDDDLATVSSSTQQQQQTSKIDVDEDDEWVKIRHGWLININPSSTRDKETGVDKASLELVFIQDDATAFREWIIYNPYFYIFVKEGHQSEVESYLKRKYENKIAGIEACEKEDLDLENHLSGIKKVYLKIRFFNVQTLMEIRNELIPIIKKNKIRVSTTEAYEDPYSKYNSISSMSGTSSHNSKKQHHQLKSATEYIMDMRESDVTYYQRGAIDLEIRVGLWYEITKESPTMPTTVRVLHERVDRPDPRVLAFDIETTHLPLKFSNAEYDEIMMISYMVDRQGFLITNRSIVSADVGDFEYTPKPEYEGPFQVFNEPNERDLLVKFFSHVRQIRPHIFVTYNGDSFDWPFIEARALVHGLDMFREIGVRNKQDEYRGRTAVHMDAFYWVKRDSYLPHGSHRLKEVIRKKLRYNPVEIDAEEMITAARDDPETLANYSVSDTVGTYYLYMTYVHPFIFSLCNIIPYNPEDVLRKGSGSLCEALLMTEAFRVNVIYPNKHIEDNRKFYKGHLLETETYVGGHVECLECGIFRYDVPTQFNLDVNALNEHIKNIDRILNQAMKEAELTDKNDIVNYESIRQDILDRLTHLRNEPNSMSNPLIYHLDVSAMYPNIILTNRLQPTSMVSEEYCATCVYNKPESNCQRTLNWQWRGDYIPATSSEYKLILQQLEYENHVFNGEQKSFNDLPNEEQNILLKKRLKEYSRKVYKKNHIVSSEIRSDTVCMRENSFYVDTVKLFRDRRYEYKALHSEWKNNLDQSQKGASGSHDYQKCVGMVVMYESMQLAHKCILNSFYGYVMRKGSRWYSMEMAGIVTHTGSNIIKNARESVEQLGRPLELDTDGIWCILPERFPEEFAFKTKGGKTKKFNFLNVLLNDKVAESFTNHQYQEYDPITKTYTIRNECSIQFESDGPYGCMFIPTGKEKDVKLKKRYVVFNKQGGICELKGFEVKRRGELELIKSFQTELFQYFMKGDSLESCYNAIATTANRWLDLLDSHADGYEEDELIRLITESSKMSRKLTEYEGQKSSAIGTARKMCEFLGDEIVKDAGLFTSYIISCKPHGAPVTERTIPVEIFKTDEDKRAFFLKKWTNGYSQLKDIIDWDYYRQRLSGVIQKMITIPAALQNVSNPVPRVIHPDWILKELKKQTELRKQTSITSFFSAQKPGEADTGAAAGEVDMESMFDKRFAHLPKPVFTKHKKRAKIQVIDSDDEDHQPKDKDDDDNDDDDDDEEDEQVQLKSKKKIKQQSITDFFKKGDSTVDATSAAARPTISKAPKMEDNFSGWLSCKKKEWRKLRERIKAKKLGRFTGEENRVGHLAQQFSTQNEAVKKGLWQVISIEPSGAVGVFIFWSLIGDMIVPIKVQVNRVFYINSFSEEPPLEGAKKVLVAPPRSKERLYLTRNSMSEEDYITQSRSISNIFTDPDTEGVYETKVELDQRAIIQVGCVAAMVRADLKTVHNNNTKYQLEDIQNRPDKQQSYLAQQNFHTIYVYANAKKDGKDGVYAIFYSHNHTATIIYANPYTSHNISDKLLNSLSEKHPNVKFSLEIGKSIDGAKKLVNAQLQVYIGARRGATIVITQCSEFMKRDIPALREFPKVAMPYHDQDSNYSPFNWEVHCIKPIATRYEEVDKWWMHYVGMARYSNIPIGNLVGGDYAQMVTDTEFSRLLTDSSHLLWMSYSNSPDLGGTEEDDAKFHEELPKIEINQPDSYSTVCFELDLANLAVNTILESAHLADIEGIIGGELNNGDPTIFTQASQLQHQQQQQQQTPTQAPSRLNNKQMTHLNSCDKEFNILRKLVTKWSLDLVMGNKRAHQYPSILLTHFYRWISSPYSGLYDPILHRTLHGLMKKVFLQLVFEFKKLGAKIIYGNFNKLIICTQKQTVEDAKAYCQYILAVIKKKELFSWLNIKPVKCWHNLLWMDSSNYSGVSVEEEKDQEQEEEEEELEGSTEKRRNHSPDTIDGKLESHWNISDFLPQSLQTSFLLVISDYIRKLHIYSQTIDKEMERMVSSSDKKEKEKEKDQTNQDDHNNNNGTIDVDQPSSSSQQKEPSKNPSQDQWNEIEKEKFQPFKWEKVVDCNRIFQMVQSLRVSDHSDAIHLFPSLPGSHLSMTNPSLEFVKFVCHTLSLDRSLYSNVQRLRKNLMKMINIREFSDEAKFNDPCLSFVMPDVICPTCYNCRDLDLLREDHSSTDGTSKLACSACHNPYNRSLIESVLVETVQRRSLSYHLQDFKCQKCGQIKADNLSEICATCSGQWQCRLNSSDFNRDLTIFKNIAKYYQFEWLLEIVQDLTNLH
ncbi:putative DNA polymerase epsilon subunit A [Cavenderia fasciculata]|uniref:DNA polymerase epsilon catalytic subunit n=1 Tax=Cavenderia fasciculata TaxID=261658 RepID=F4PWS2_CACFS|nr:putative DNA polymerase epsilon subunit A [Cavenderia fasciculata]EGG20436.1 putative DNA polymerase epsilon subunit A [Cavenderia fasciculata]|eukprot:XP_004367419.1 putative DNA polymerase epsilon subunit A [Cavenderia fasciculata]